MNYQLRHGTSNRKLGPGAYVVTLSRDTCPSDCPLKSAGCYAGAGPLAITWNRVTRGDAKADGITRWTGSGFAALAADLLAHCHVPGSIVRIGDAGDPSHSGAVPLVLIRALVELKRRGLFPILYTHTDPNTARNQEAARVAREGGVALNFSGHGPSGVPRTGYEFRVTTRGPEDPVPPGAVLCPQETHGLTCAECRLCSIPRGKAVAFTAHGTQAKAVAAVS